MPKPEKQSIFYKYKHIVSTVMFLVGVITFFIALSTWLFLIGDQIDQRIDKRITDKAYIENLSKTLRPFLIFNGNGVIEYDHGAANQVSKITFNKGQKTITILFTRHIKVKPLLIIIGDLQYAYRAERVKDNGWRFTLDDTSLFMNEPSKFGNKYVLELLN